MNREKFNEIKQNLSLYKFSSLQYEEYEHISKFNVFHMDSQLLLLIGMKENADIHELHWASNDAAKLIEAIKDLDNNILITFVPREWKSEFERQGFKEYGVFRDYFIRNINEIETNNTSYSLINSTDYVAASDVTKSCRLQSREFLGESPEWMETWVMGTNPDAQGSDAHACNVIVHRINETVAGIVCVGTYKNSDNSLTLWIREIAVRPEHQGKGIGKKLLLQGIQYGKEYGATKAFLMADECNTNAIKLYKSVGFVPNMEEEQIDMIYECKK